MFEQDQNIVDALISENTDFKRLYDKHSQLKIRVRNANQGDEAIDDFDLESMKKEKLLLKDKMASMIEDYRLVHA